jgi:hypothetical protein
MGLVMTEEKMIKTAKEQSNLKYNRLWKVSNVNQILTDSGFSLRKNRNECFPAFLPDATSIKNNINLGPKEFFIFRTLIFI